MSDKKPLSGLKFALTCASKTISLPEIENLVVSNGGEVESLYAYYPQYSPEGWTKPDSPLDFLVVVGEGNRNKIMMAERMGLQMITLGQLESMVTDISEKPTQPTNFERSIDELREHEMKVALVTVKELSEEFKVDSNLVLNHANRINFTSASDFRKQLHNVLTNEGFASHDHQPKKHIPFSWPEMDGGAGAIESWANAISRHNQMRQPKTLKLVDIHHVEMPGFVPKEVERMKQEYANSFMTMQPHHSDELSALSPSTYDDWIAKGKSLFNKSRGSEGGLKAWHDFSSQSDKYASVDCDHMWECWKEDASSDLPEAGPDNAAEWFDLAVSDPDHPYHELAWALLGAFEQASMGKGKERHANDLPFTEQRMQTISQGLGTETGLIYQANKKSQESCAMDTEAAVRELGGAIVYLAGAIIFRQH